MPRNAGGQEESHRIVAVPPLHHRVDDAGVDDVGLGSDDRNRQIVDDVQHGDGDDVGGEEPVGDVDVLDLADRQRAEEHDRVGHPDHGDQQVDRPLEFGIFLALRDAERQRDGREQDHQLPSPEGEGRELVGDQPHVAGALHDVIGTREQRASRRRRRSPRWCAAAAVGRSSAKAGRNSASARSTRAAMNTPTAMPTMPQMMVMIANWRTTVSL